MEKPKGLIKTTPESFIVQELVGRRNIPVPLHERTSIQGFRGGKPITVFDLVKKDWNTNEAVEQVARQLRVEKSKISMYGLKDRRAYTAQMIGVEGEFVPHFAHNDIILCQTGERERPLIHGHNAGNRFQIQVFTDEKKINASALEKFRNYFGRQRFGKFDSYRAGKLILEGKYAEAVKQLSDDKVLSSKLKDLMRYNRSWQKAFLDASVAFEIGMIVLQWQSHLWNTLLAELANPPDYLPVWNPESEAVRSLYKHLWNPDLVSLLDSDSRTNNTKAFALLHRFDRPTVICPKNIKVERKLVGWEFCFDLRPGAYATEALAQIFDLWENR